MAGVSEFGIRRILHVPDSACDDVAMAARGEPSRAGRRRGKSGTREAIEASARRLFAEVGYDRTSMRAIAAAAGVDPSLVGHFFGSKQRLFVTVVELPFEPEAVVPALLAGERATVGRRFAEFVVGLLEDPEARARVVGIVRAAASEPGAADAVRALLSHRILGPIAAALDADQPELRANLVGTQTVGLVLARHIVRVEPIASLGREALIDAIAPTLQRYLVEPLGAEGTTSRPEV
jgi:AcrR family transcriptional regulator